MLSPHELAHAQAELPQWHRVKASHLLRWPLSQVPGFVDRTLVRLVGVLATRRVLRIDGWENILPRHDPFVLVANHSSRREAVLLPALLMLARGGSPVRFLADWNFQLIPGVGYFYRRSGAITITRKDARPRFLNLFKPLFAFDRPPHEEARNHLLKGGSVGLFPEGSVNRNAEHLLRGRRGAARLSLEAGVPVVPVGIRFSRLQPSTGEIDPSSDISIHIGEAMSPEHKPSGSVSPRMVTEWHGGLMLEIARLSGKTWAGVGELAPTGADQATGAEWSSLPTLLSVRRGDATC